MSKGTSKAQVRASKAGKYYKGKDEDEVEEEMQQNNSAAYNWVQENFPDPMSLAAGCSLVVMLAVLVVLIWVNSTGGIEPYMKNGPLKVVLLDTEADRPASAKSKDHEDLLETYQAVDSIERAVQHGNIAGARMVLDQLEVSAILTAKDIAALRKLVDDAEMLNPIADIAMCVVQEAFTLVEEKGGKFIKNDDGEIAVMMADFDQDQEQPDGRGRGIAALVEVKEGDVLMEIPVASGMSVWAAEKSPTLGKVIKEQKLKSFEALALMLLHESHKVDSAHRKHLCSMPLHCPVPFLWIPEDLPKDFLAHEQLNNERLFVMNWVDLSYNMTVPAVLEKYPDLFTEDQLSRNKWGWAFSIIYTRAIAMSKSFMGSYQLESSELLDAKLQFEILQGNAKETAVPVLLPIIDMMNHEGTNELSCKLKVGSDGTVTVTGSPGGLKRGYEVAISYGDWVCGTRSLNRWGFVLPACPGEEEEEAAETEGQASGGEAESTENKEGEGSTG